MSQCTADHTRWSQQQIFDAFLERERLGTTSVDGSVPIPHGKLASLGQLYELFALLKTPIDFELTDEKSVDRVFLLLASMSAGTDYF